MCVQTPSNLPTRRLRSSQGQSAGIHPVCFVRLVWKRGLPNVLRSEGNEFINTKGIHVGNAGADQGIKAFASDALELTLLEFVHLLERADEVATTVVGVSEGSLLEALELYLQFRLVLYRCHWLNRVHGLHWLDRLVRLHRFHRLIERSLRAQLHLVANGPRLPITIIYTKLKSHIVQAQIVLAATVGSFGLRSYDMDQHSL
uniref:Uncharacterized protein n=1 Tax=Anopheles atroparvus TaxID=41427 RepID=A0A182JN82_ANOAO